MFKHSLRHTFTALLVWAVVLLILLAAGARSTPRDPPPEELAGDPFTALRTAVRYPTPLPATQTPTPTTLPTKAPRPYGVQIYPSLLYTSRAQLNFLSTVVRTAARYPTPLPPTQAPTPTPLPTMDPGPYEVQIFPGIRYTSKAQLDIFAPTEPGDWPVVIAFSESLGPRESLHELARSVASYGAVVFVPSWRSLSKPFVKQAVENAACAIRFARQHAVEYGGVPDRITGTGVGNGAWIVALMGLIGDEFDGDCLVKGGSGYLDGVVAMSGPYNLITFWQHFGDPYDPAPREFWEMMSPVLYPAQIPPREGLEYHLFVSDDLYWEYVDDTSAFYTALKDGGYQAQLTVLPESYNFRFTLPLPETVQAIMNMAWGKSECGSPERASRR